MKIWTAHTKPAAAPILVSEGFSWGAFILGPLWLLLRGAWIPGALAVVVWLLLGTRPAPFGPLFLLGLHWGLGLVARDLVRWSLGLRGYLLAHVVAAGNEDAALARLLDRRPDLIAAAIALPADR